MNRTPLIAGGIFGLLGVALGAFGAHGLRSITSDESILHSYQTGVQYQVYHALALLAVGILSKDFPGAWMKRAGVCFIIGILLFSGSLYLLSILKIQESGMTKFAGPVTPLGGVFFMLGWICLLWGVADRKSRASR
jgi:uncharacterized membrane protein YgdD (TMEM256/DUF423 family)